MNTEKITIERFIEETFLICDVSGVGQAKMMKPEMKRIINVFLEQIKDEIISSTYSYNFISQRNIENVFNKYLNEKGGK